MARLSLIQRTDGIWVGQFEAMASPCEILARCASKDLALRALEAAKAEARRVEQKFSRYRDDSVVHQIHASTGRPIELDDETSGLLDLAADCWEISEGAFDVTSGILRRAWQFKAGSRPPKQSEIDTLLPFVGWQRLSWQRPQLTLPLGMEIDLGGLGKEYAVDRVSAELETQPGSYLVNFGGDIRTTSLPEDQAQGWTVGIESPDADVPEVVELKRGALATSGDTHRFVLDQGVRYGHVLDPRTGWPPSDAPRTTTAHAETCLEAGLFATLAILQGARAEEFFREQGVPYWIIR